MNLHTIPNCIIEELKPLISNNLNKLIAQSYNGAYVMSRGLNGVQKLITFNTIKIMSNAVEQVVACTLVMQWARVRSPVVTGFLGEVFLGFFLICKTNVRKL